MSSLARFQSDIRRYLTRLDQSLNKSLPHISTILQDNVKAHAPVKTGALKRSIKKQATGRVAKAYTQIIYGGYVTKYRPYIERGYNASKKEILLFLTKKLR